MKNILHKENPDFVAVTGDIVSGFAWDHQTPSWWDRQHHKMRSVLEEYKVAYGMVPGYHDLEADASTGLMLNIDGRSRYSTSYFNDFRLDNKAMSHNFTYKVDIESATKSDEIQLRLWFFGTGRNDCMGLGGNDCIRRDAIHWYKDESMKIPDSDKFK